MGKLSLLQNQMKKLAWEIMSLERNSYLMLFNQQVSLYCKYAKFYCAQAEGLTSVTSIIMRQYVMLVTDI